MELGELVGQARAVAREVIAPRAEEEDRAGQWPEAAMRALAAAGLMGLHVPERLGGHGHGLRALVRVSEVLAHESPSTALCYAMHCVGTAVIAAKATAHHEACYLAPIASGEHVTTLALSEPGSGAHFYIPSTQLASADGDYVVTGTKSFVTNGGRADSYVVSTVAPHAASAEHGRFSVVVVDGTDPALAWQDGWDGFGMRSNSSRTVRLNGVRIPRRQLLGEEGDQLWYVFEVVAPYFLMAMAGTYLGVAAECLRLAAEHLGSRRHAHTGELLGAQPILAHRLGALWVQVEQARRLIYWGAEEADTGGEQALLGVFSAKLAAANAAVSVANEAMTLTGGISYRANAKLARYLRDARASHVMAPTTDILQAWIGRGHLGLPLL